MTEAAIKEIPPGIAMIHSNRMEELKNLFLHWVKDHPLSPFERETVLVQSNGIRQWLKLGFADNTVLGISADIDFLLPSPFIWNTYRAVLPDISIKPKSLLDRGPLTWRLYQMLPKLLEAEPERYAPLSRFLNRNPHPIKLYQLAEQLADLFDQYQVHRADWLLDWSDETSANANRIRKKANEEGTIEILGDQLWQPSLWRALIRELGADDWGSNSRSTLHQELMQRIDEIAEGNYPRPDEVPKRIFVFGISSLPRQTLETLGQLGKISQVFFFVQNPCRYYWANIIEGAELLKSKRFQVKKGTPDPSRSDDMHLFGNPLLAAWGKQGRDFVRLLDDWDDVAQSERLFKNDYNHFIDEIQNADTLLKKVQWGIFNLDTTPRGTEDSEAYDGVKSTDDSITFHIAHSPQREVEILHDQLLRLFDKKEGKSSNLQPRDVLVMLPDVDRYAPFIDAVFGRREPRESDHAPPLIPYAIADRKNRGHNPIFKALESLLRLPESRFPASEILDLLEVEAVRNKFGLKPEDLPTLSRWIRDAGIRWGLDSGQRVESLNLTESSAHSEWDQNTWEFGLNRLFMGYAMGDGDPVDEISPYPEIGGIESRILGSLNALIEALRRLAQELKRDARPSDWGTRFDDILEDFFEAKNSNDERSLATLKQTLEQWAEDSDAEHFEEMIPLVVAREAWMSVFDKPSLTQRFLGGNVHFCTLMPMRSIPFKVVCLLGMNAGDYPRQQHPRAFDLMQQKDVYRPGDRSKRDDDRYMFLEALLSAQDRLLISWVGRNIRDNSKQEASVLVNQLRDHLAAGWHLLTEEKPEPDQDKAGEKLVAHLTLEYPLQPFSEKYAAPSPERNTESVIPLFTYAHEWQQVSQEHETSKGEMENPLDIPHAPNKLTFKSLTQFLRNPPAHFFNARLNVYFERGESLIEDDESFVIDALQNHQIKARVLEGLKSNEANDTIDNLLQKIRLEGQFPVSAAGDILSDDIKQIVLNVIEQEQSITGDWLPALPDPVDLQNLEIKTSSGQTLIIEDWLTKLHPHAEDPERFAVFTLTPSVLHKKGEPPRLDKMFALWVRQLAANATGIKLESYLVGPDTVLHLTPINDPKEALALLSDLTEGWLQGLTAPLPLAPEAALAFLNAKHEESEKKAKAKYDGDSFNSGEVTKSIYFQRAYPDFARLGATHIGGKGFADWAQSIYGPLKEICQKRGLEA